MATISFFAGFEIKDEEKALRILEVLKEPGVPVSLTPEERENCLKNRKKLEKPHLTDLETYSRNYDFFRLHTPSSPTPKRQQRLSHTF